MTVCLVVWFKDCTLEVENRNGRPFSIFRKGRAALRRYATPGGAAKGFAVGGAAHVPAGSVRFGGEHALACPAPSGSDELRGANRRAVG